MKLSGKTRSLFPLILLFWAILACGRSGSLGDLPNNPEPTQAGSTETPLPEQPTETEVSAPTSLPPASFPDPVGYEWNRTADGFQRPLFLTHAGDGSGRLFVVEMPGYPLDTSASGRVKLLEDADGDGRFERSTVYASDLVLPTGVMRHRQGVLVTAAPDVLYLADEDGDGRAERRERVLTGFAFSNPQHTVNTPLYGLDNWIHLAHEGPAGAVIYPELFGDRGSPIRFPDRPGSPEVAVGRRAVRFRPETLEIEAKSGHSQFGHAFDEWGRYLTLDNSNHARHEVIAARYLKRNPELPVASAMQNVSDHGSNAKVYAITRNPRFELLTEPGEFTSACGMTLDTGGLFSTSDAQSGFVAEPVQNLVHRDLWSERGSTFVARRALEEREFLASTDSWFRPVFLAIGPDAALYVGSWSEWGGRADTPIEP